MDFPWIVALDPNENRVRIRFDEPPLVGGMFLTELGASLLVSPPGAMGFYWEPSAGSDAP